MGSILTVHFSTTDAFSLPSVDVVGGPGWNSIDIDTMQASSARTFILNSGDEDGHPPDPRFAAQKRKSRDGRTDGRTDGREERRTGRGLDGDGDVWRDDVRQCTTSDDERRRTDGEIREARKGEEWDRSHRRRFRRRASRRRRRRRRRRFEEGARERRRRRRRCVGAEEDSREDSGEGRLEGRGLGRCHHRESLRRRFRRRLRAGNRLRACPR